MSSDDVNVLHDGDYIENERIMNVDIMMLIHIENNVIEIYLAND